MVEKCANPECSKPFCYGLGRLYFSPKPLADKSPPANGHGVEHYWLCESCSKSITFGLRVGSGVEITPRSTTYEGNRIESVGRKSGAA
jgi:hypothetical protein